MTQLKRVKLLLECCEQTFSEAARQMPTRLNENENSPALCHSLRSYSTKGYPGCDISHKLSFSLSLQHRGYVLHCRRNRFTHREESISMAPWRIHLRRT